MKQCRSRACEEIFEPQHNSTQYCSKLCANHENYQLKKDRGFKQYSKKPLEDKICKSRDCQMKFSTHRDNKEFCCNSCAKREAYKRNQDIEGSYAYKKQIKTQICQNVNCTKPLEQNSHARKYCSVKCSKQQNFRNQNKKTTIEVKVYKDTKQKAKAEHGNAKDIYIAPKWLTRYGVSA